MPNKSRLPLEEKVLIVKNYIDGLDSLNGCSKKHGISNETILTWARLYKNRGVEGLMPAVKNRKYSVELKTMAVEDYLSKKGSLLEICDKYDITKHGILQRWILCYNGHGDFKQPKEGSINHMTKGRNTTFDERVEIVGYCISNNKDYGKTAEKYNVSYQQVYVWVKKCEIDGIDGLADRRGKRKDKSSMNEVEKLQAEIKLKDAEVLRLRMENDLLKKLEALERGQNID